MPKRQATNKNNFNKSNSNKFKNRGRRPKKVEIDIDRADINKADLHQSEDNDKSWYARNDQIMKDATNFSRGYPLGITLPSRVMTPYNLKIPTGAVTGKYGIPGIMTLEYIPTIGVSKESQSPINIAARAQYSFVRYANSGSAVGDPSDQMFYFVAADSLFMWHQSLCRVYGVMRLHDYLNQYQPDAIVQALGFNYSDLNRNLAQFRSHINMLALRINRIAVPNDMAYMLRHAWMASGLYTDSAAYKAQMYAYVPKAFFKYNEVEEGPNNVVYVSPWLSSNGSTIFSTINFEQIKTFSDVLLNAVLQSESFGITTGDIMKAYGRDKLFMLAEIGEDYSVMPAYSPEVLSQMENTDIIPMTLSDLDQLNPEQNTEISADGYIEMPGKLNITYSGGSAASAMNLLTSNYFYLCGLQSDRLMNFHIDQIDNGDVMVASRLMAGINIDTSVKVDYTNSASSGKISFELSSCGSEIVIDAKIHTIYSTSNDVTKICSIPWVSGYAPGGTDVNLFERTRFGVLLQQFDWHLPWIQGIPSEAVNWATSSSTSVNGAFLGDTRDIDNYGIVSNANIDQMHEVALLSLFDSPNIQIMAKTAYRK